MGTELKVLSAAERTIVLRERGQNTERQRLVLRVLWVITCIGVIIGSLLPSTSKPMELLSNVNDKLIHFGSYGWLAFLPMLREPPRTAIICVATVLLMGIALEFGQGLTGYRTLDPFDALANATGICCGVLLGMWSRFLTATEHSANPR